MKIVTEDSDSGDIGQFLKEARERMTEAIDKDRNNRDMALEDVRFFDGDQWPADMEQKRKGTDRPCLVINKLPEKVDQVVGDQRQNNPGIHVVPVDDKSDPEVAEILEGVFRSIESNNEAKDVYNSAFESTVVCGRGFWRVGTRYVDPLSFDQEITLSPINNQFTVYWDANTKQKDFSDADYVFVTSMGTREAFERDHPGKLHASMEGDLMAEAQDWRGSHGQVRIAEYWVKHRTKVHIYLLSDGSVVDVPPPDLEDILDEDGLPDDMDMPTVVAERDTEIVRVFQYIISGVDILEGPTEFPSKHFGIIPVWGKEINVAGERILRGLVRHAKDAQRMLNYWESSATEVVALAPKVPWILTADQIDGYEAEWDVAHEKNMPYLVYNYDGMAPPPKRTSPAAIPTGMERRSDINSQHIESTTGIYAAGVGAPSNETSGRAILARQRKGDTATYAFIDNLIRAQRHSAKVIIDMIPKIYDVDRILRIVGKDGKEQTVRVNEKRIDAESGAEIIVNDLSVGKYDVVIETGPAYNTLRQEAAEAMLKLAQSSPELFALIGDIVVGEMDWPRAREVADRLKLLLPPEANEDDSGPSKEEQEMKQLEFEGIVAEVESKQLGNKLQELEIAEKMAELTPSEGIESGQTTEEV